MNILIVDDEEVLQDVLTALIRQEGHHPICCATGQEALTVLAQEEIDLVLLDLMLPDMNGREVMRRIRQSDPDQVVVVITAYSSIEGAIEAMREGRFPLPAQAVQERRGPAHHPPGPGAPPPDRREPGSQGATP